MANVDESKLDTLRDVAGYALIGMLIQGNDWNEKLLNRKHGTPLIREYVESVLDLFLDKLHDYGVGDLKELGQVTQRIKEKIERVEHLESSKDPLGDKVQVKTTGKGGIHAPNVTDDNGYDLVVSENTWIHPLPNKPTIVPAGVSMKIPKGHYAQIVGRSSAANKLGLMVHTATIDNGYTGEMFACTWNMTDESIEVREGQRIAQVIFLPTCTPELKIVDFLPDTERGDKGFGSTGK